MIPAPVNFTGSEKDVKISILLISIVTLAACAASAQVNIPILNPQFNWDVLTGNPGASQVGITGWITGPTTGTFKASTTQFPSLPTTGLYCAYVGSAQGYSSGSIFQTLGATVQANTVYVLKVIVGARADAPFGGYIATLMAGNVALIAGNKATPVGGTFVTEEVVYSSGPTPAQLGQPLQILIKSTGIGQVDIPSVSLTAIAQ